MIIGNVIPVTCLSLNKVCVFKWIAKEGGGREPFDRLHGKWAGEIECISPNKRHVLLLMCDPLT